MRRGPRGRRWMLMRRGEKEEMRLNEVKRREIDAPHGPCCD